MSYGIDTIKIGVQVDRSKIDLKGWIQSKQSVRTKNEDTYSDDDIFLSQYFQKVCRASNYTAVTLRYIPRNYKGKKFEMLFIEFSIPKLVYGCNYRDLDNWDSEFEIVNGELSRILHFFDFRDIRNLQLYRIDLCANLWVGEEAVQFYLQALRRANHPHRKLHFHDNSVSFKSKEISSTIYDKCNECKSEGARGILKYEIQIRNCWKIKDWTGKRETTLADITKEKIRSLLLDDMRMLDLDRPIYGDINEVDRILSGLYSKCKTRNLLGYLLQRQGKTRKELKDNGFNEKTLSTYEKLLASAGVSSISIDEKVRIPALTTLLDTEIGKNYQKVPSATTTLYDQN